MKNKPKMSLASLRGSAEEKLERYTCRPLGYAFNTYDHLGEVDTPISPGDVLMANLLSLKLSAPEVIPLFADGDGPAQQLRKALTTLWLNCATRTIWSHTPTYPNWNERWKAWPQPTEQLWR